MTGSYSTGKIMQDLRAKVTANRAVSSCFRVLTVELCEGELNADPGQFVQILVGRPGGSGPLLRRPFSVMDLRGKKVDLLYKVIGPGTEEMASWRRGCEVFLLGSLGTGFDLTGLERGDRVAVIAGGTGLGGVYMLLKRLARMKVRAVLYFGVRSKNEVPHTLLDRLDCVTKLADQTRGILVTDRFAGDKTARFRKAFVCGPTGMIVAAGKLLAMRKIPVQVSLEEMMGCGFGICYTCPVRKKGSEGYFRACVEGPVFDWDGIDLAAGD